MTGCCLSMILTLIEVNFLYNLLVLNQSAVMIKTVAFWSGQDLDVEQVRNISCKRIVISDLAEESKVAEIGTMFLQWCSVTILLKHQRHI